MATARTSSRPGLINGMADPVTPHNKQKKPAPPEDNGLWTIPALLLCLSLLGAHSAWSQVTTDEYIAGFATAVLQHEFKAVDSRLQVSNGVVRISAQSLSGLDRAKVQRALAGIAGVKEVVIIENEETATSPPPHHGVLVDVPETESSFLPRGLLFAPLHADPRWPHFAAVYRGYRTNNLSAAFAGNFGETFSLYRHRAPFNGQWEFVVQAGVFSLFDLSATSLDLVNADYTVGVLTAYRSGRFFASPPPKLTSRR